MRILLRAKQLINNVIKLNPLLYVGLFVAARLLPHPANLSPVDAMVLFAGVYLNRRYALIAPLVALFISDMFLGFYWQMPFVYGSFIITGLLGLWLRHHKSITNILGFCLLSSVQFFVISNFGVWLTTSFYIHTLSGLINCYVMALPFFRNSLIGDLVYTSLFFGSYEFIVFKLIKYKQVLNKE